MSRLDELEDYEAVKKLLKRAWELNAGPDPAQRLDPELLYLLSMVTGALVSKMLLLGPLLGVLESVRDSSHFSENCPERLRTLVDSTCTGARQLLKEKL